jgi:hypothetical protein
LGAEPPIFSLKQSRPRFSRARGQKFQKDSRFNAKQAAPPSKRAESTQQKQTTRLHYSA